jgi:hypothetical protein
MKASMYDGFINLKHDGYTFNIFPNNVLDTSYDIIGVYVDNCSYLQVIKRNSLYGEIALKKVALDLAEFLIDSNSKKSLTN